MPHLESPTGGAGIPIPHIDILPEWNVLGPHNNPRIQSTGIDWDQIKKIKLYQIVLPNADVDTENYYHLPHNSRTIRTGKRLERARNKELHYCTGVGIDKIISGGSVVFDWGTGVVRN